MAQPSPQSIQWLAKRYPRPEVDREWLQGCCEWLTSQPGADPSSRKFLEDIEAQLLQSDLRDSMLQGTGLPVHITRSDHEEANTRLTGSPILVEIAAITEIASSAYQLDQIRSAREERMRAGQFDDDNDQREADLEVEGEGPMPKYPRGMLRFELSDGTTTLNAIEYRPIPELALGKTPLGYKILLKNTMMRHGIAFLEPNTIVLKGYQTADRETLQNYDFARGLRVRMGFPIDPPDENLTIAQPAPAPVRSPLREISPPPEPTLDPTYNDDAHLEPRRRKLPATNTILPTPGSTTTSATLVPSLDTDTSSYFSSSHPTSSFNNQSKVNGLNLGLTPAQASRAPPRATNDDDEDLFDHFDNIGFFDGADGDIVIDENIPPPVQENNTKPVPPVSSNIPPSSTLPKYPPKTAAIAGTQDRSLAQEDSIEIVSFAPSQAASQRQQKEKAKDKAKISSVPPALELEADFLDGLDEIEVARLTDPDFLAQRTEEIISDGSSSLPRTSSSPQPPGRQPAGRKGKHARSIAPLPRRSLAPQTQSKRSLPVDADIIHISSSSSSIYESDTDFDVDFDAIEEEGDKENVPVMTRHVRQKVTSGEGGSSGGLFGGGDKRSFVSNEVIDLSDED